MAAPDREPFPYTEDFRRAKRNSLIWSGITVAAALGSPAVSGGPVTMGQTSFNLGFDQSVVVGLSGAVAIFMAVGFYQAMQRLRLHASNLFAGSTDVDRAFQRLSEAATQAAGDIDNISSRAVAMLEQVQNISLHTGDWTEAIRNEADILSIFETMPPFNAHPLLLQEAGWEAKEEQYRKYIESLREWQERLSGNFKGADDRLRDIIGKARPEIEGLRGTIDTIIGEFQSSERDRIDGHFRKIEADVRKLQQFHQGIYRRDILWFWLYDVVPVASLFTAAAWVFVRQLFV